MTVQEFVDRCKVTAAKRAVEVADLILHRVKQTLRPSVLLEVGLTKVAPELWEASYDGVLGYGDCPEHACQAFDELWAGFGNGVYATGRGSSGAY
jgi:hypothetical protein